MKNLIIIIVLFVTSIVNAQIGFNKVEYFTVNAYGDVVASFKEHGYDVGVEVEYVGKIYAKVGAEYFDAINYSDIHGAIGVNIIIGRESEIRLYAGGGAARVKRWDIPGDEDSGKETNPRFEAGIDYAFNSGLFLGLRYMYEKRFDMQLYGWDVIKRHNGYVRVGYRWDWRDRGFEQ